MRGIWAFAIGWRIPPGRCARSIWTLLHRAISGGRRAHRPEYVADYERIGRRALRRPEWKGRLKLFEIYFLSDVEYRRAITLVGVAAGTFDYWLGEVKRTLGREYSRTGLFPPSRYFHS